MAKFNRKKIREDFGKVYDTLDVFLLSAVEKADKGESLIICFDIFRQKEDDGPTATVEEWEERRVANGKIVVTPEEDIATQ